MTEQPAPSQTSSRAITLLAIVAVIAVMYFARAVLIPFALAVLLSFILAPVVNFLERLRLGRVLSVVVVVLLAFLMLAGMAQVMFTQVFDVADQIPKYTDNIKEKIKTLTPGRESFIEKVNEAAERVSESIEEAAEEVAEEDGNAEQTPATATQPTGPPEAATDPIPVQVTETAGTTAVWLENAGMVVEGLATAAVVTVFVVFILIERRGLRDRIIQLAGRRKLKLTTAALDEAATRVSRYLLTQLLINFLYGLPVAIGLWLVGLPNAFLWGLVAMFMRFIPYAGPWIGAAFPSLLALAVFDGWILPAIVIGMFVVLELISNNVLEPWLYGSQTGVSSLAVLVSAVFWAWLWGPVGLILALPLTVCVVVAGRYVPELKFLTVLLEDAEEPEPPTPAQSASPRKSAAKNASE